MRVSSKVFVNEKSLEPWMRRRALHKACSRQSVFEILCAERMRPQKTDGNLETVLTTSAEVPP